MKNHLLYVSSNSPYSTKHLIMYLFFPLFTQFYLILFHFLHLSIYIVQYQIFQSLKLKLLSFYHFNLSAKPKPTLNQTITPYLLLIHEAQLERT